MSDAFNRRGCIGVALAAAAAPALAESTAAGAALGARSHFYAQPQFRAQLVECLTRVLGCVGPRELKASGLSDPILAFNFPGGGSVSVEFTTEALTPSAMRRGAWLEIRTSDPKTLEKAVLAAGLPQVRYVTPTFYFEAPGGQVFGIVQA